MSNRNKLIAGAIALVLATFVLTSVGYFYLLQSWSGDAAGTIRLIGVVQLIKSRYVENVPVETLMNGAIKGAVNSLGDPHSVYMDPKMYKEFMIETKGSFGGVGIMLGVKDKVLTVISPIEGTPSDKAGIKSGDQIVKIDSQETKDMVLDEAVNKIRGPEGTQVVLTIRRNQDTRDYALMRSNIQIKTVSGKMLTNQIGYIRLSMFNENTGDDFANKYQELESQGMKAMILDLRDDPGGLLEESVKVAGKLIPKGPVVSVVQRDGQRDTQYSDLEKVKYPLVVLVNGGSASASEIVAGAVQDTKSGVLLGTKTYGKGSVQTIMRLDGGTAIKLTIAKYYTPSGRCINGIGIEPDYKVEDSGYKDSGRDIQLEKAMEIVAGKIHQ